LGNFQLTGETGFIFVTKVQEYSQNIQILSVFMDITQAILQIFHDQNHQKLEAFRLEFDLNFLNDDPLVGVSI
jgi:hypothetical protein